MDEKSSWMRVIITIAVDWRFVIAVVVLVLMLLLSVAAQPSGRVASFRKQVQFSKSADVRRML